MTAPLLDFDPFAVYDQAAAWADPAIPPRCPTRPWWRKLGNRWWRVGTRYTVSFPGDLRVLVWQSGLQLDADRKQNVLAHQLEVAASELDGVNGARSLGAVSLSTARVLARVDALLKVAPPPVLPGQVWCVWGLTYNFLSEGRKFGDPDPTLGASWAKFFIVDDDRTVATSRALLLHGPFAPWAPPDYAVTDDVLAAAFGQAAFGQAAPAAEPIDTEHEQHLAKLADEPWGGI